MGEDLIAKGLQADLERQAGSDSGSDQILEHELDLSPGAEQYQPTAPARADVQKANGLLPDAPWAVEYSPDILRDMLHKEDMSSCPDVNNSASDVAVGHLRACLLDWLVEVHVRLDLQTRTLFLSVLLMDSYLSKHTVTGGDFRLLGTVALLVASKFEETVEVFEQRKDAFPLMLGDEYCKDDLLRMECTLLNTVGFDLTRPTAALFAEHLGADNWRDGRNSEDHRELTWYILELSLYSASMQRCYTPSRLAVAAMLLSSRLLECCSVELHRLLQAAPQSPLQAVRRKFTSMHRS